MSPMVDGEPGAPILVVGMAPGNEEMRQGMPFVGGSGRILWGLARECGIRRHDCYIINVIGEMPKHRTKAGAEVASQVIGKWQLEKYWDEFDRLLRMSRAKVALCLGGDAFDRLTGILSYERRVKMKTGINSWRGYLVTPRECEVRTRVVEQETVYKTSSKLHKKGEPRVVRVKVPYQTPMPDTVKWIVPALHPASVMRSGLKTLRALKADVARVGRAWREELELRRVRFEVVPSRLQGDVVTDIETPADKLSRGVILRVGMAAEGGAWTSTWTKHAADVVRDVLGREDNVQIFHNRAFDQPRLEAYGVEVKGKVWDTMLAAAMLEPDLYKGLNSVASLYLDTPRWKHRAEENPEMYNAWDCVKTLEVYQQVKEAMRETGQLRLFEETIMPGSEELMRMTERGMKVDVGKMEEWKGELRERVREGEEKWMAATGVNPRSSFKVREYLDAAGVPRLESAYNSDGGTTTNAQAIRDVMRWIDAGATKREALRQALEHLLRYKLDFKLLSTYTRYELDEEECVHPSYLPAAKDDENLLNRELAGTWRAISREPNLQNVPLEARKIFVPRRRDYVFVEADYKQIELRIAAQLSGDEDLQAVLEKGDVFTELAKKIKVTRAVAKTVMYSTLYGSGYKKLYKVLRGSGYEVAAVECKGMQSGLAESYPRLWRWRERMAETARAEHELTNPFGLKRYFYAREDGPAAIDFNPQSTAAIIMWKAVREVAEALREIGGWAVNTVHDNVLCEVPKDRIGEGKRRIKETMERVRPEVGKGWKVPVKVKAGVNWRDVSEEEDDA